MDENHIKYTSNKFDRIDYIKVGEHDPVSSTFHMEYVLKGDVQINILHIKNGKTIRVDNGKLERLINSQQYLEFKKLFMNSPAYILNLKKIIELFIAHDAFYEDSIVRVYWHGEEISFIHITYNMKKDVPQVPSLYDYQPDNASPIRSITEFCSGYTNSGSSFHVTYKFRGRIDDTYFWITKDNQLVAPWDRERFKSELSFLPKQLLDNKMKMQMIYPDYAKILKGFVELILLSDTQKSHDDFGVSIIESTTLDNDYAPTATKMTIIYLDGAAMFEDE